MKKKYAPRLASQESRESNTSQLPWDVRKILKILAREEGQSVSWIIEQILVTHLNLDIDYKVTISKRK